MPIHILSRFACRFRLAAILLLPAALGACASKGAAPSAASGPVVAELVEVAEGFTEPLDIQAPRDGSGRLFVAEHGGVIKILDRERKLLPGAFLDLSDKGLDRIFMPPKESDERGLLAMTFHPKFKKNGRLFVMYTRKGDFQSVISEFKVSPDDPNKAATEERIILGPIHQPQWNHNGGALAFGPDGRLYISLGDGGMRADAGPGHNKEIGNGQDANTLLGKMLRIDVDRPAAGKNYGIPKDNPFADGKGGLPEIYALGLRNVWRFSFDRKTGRLFAGDVGQDLWEEIDIIERGGNYGWRQMEGAHCFNPPEGCKTEGMKLPIHEYHHKPEEGGGLSITGGYVYRGKKFPEFEGLYFFADYASGRFWTLKEEPAGKWTAQEHFRVGFYIPTFGEDEEGELYVCNKFGGKILQVAPKRP